MLTCNFSPICILIVKNIWYPNTNDAISSNLSFFPGLAEALLPVTLILVLDSRQLGPSPPKGKTSFTKFSVSDLYHFDADPFPG